MSRVRGPALTRDRIVQTNGVRTNGKYDKFEICEHGGAEEIDLVQRVFLSNRVGIRLSVRKESNARVSS